MTIPPLETTSPFEALGIPVKTGPQGPAFSDFLRAATDRAFEPTEPLRERVEETAGAADRPRHEERADRDTRRAADRDRADEPAAGARKRDRETSPEAERARGHDEAGPGDESRRPEAPPRREPARARDETRSGDETGPADKAEAESVATSAPASVTDIPAAAGAVPLTGALAAAAAGAAPTSTPGADVSGLVAAAVLNEIHQAQGARPGPVPAAAVGGPATLVSPTALLAAGAGEGEAPAAPQPGTAEGQQVEVIRTGLAATAQAAVEQLKERLARPGEGQRPASGERVGVKVEVARAGEQMVSRPSASLAPNAALAAAEAEGDEGDAQPGSAHALGKGESRPGTAAGAAGPATPGPQRDAAPGQPDPNPAVGRASFAPLPGTAEGERAVRARAESRPGFSPAAGPTAEPGRPAGATGGSDGAAPAGGAFAPSAPAGAASTGASQAGRPPLPPPAVSQQVAVHILKAVDQGSDRISIQLRPESLGRVDVRLDVGHDGRVSAMISAERPETLELLQRDARSLERALQDAGLGADSNSLSFNLLGRGSREPGFGRDLAGVGLDAPLGPEADEAPIEVTQVDGASYVSRGAGGVDIRV